MATEAETKEPMPEHEKIVGGKLENERHLTGNGTNSEEMSEVKVETEMEAAEKHAMDINEKITADKTTFKDITDVTEAHIEEKGNKSHDETVPTDKLEEEEIESKNGNLKDDNLNSSISGTKQSEKENTNGPTEINTSNILKRGTTEQEEENLKKVIEGKEVEIQAGDIKMQGVESISIAEPTEVEQKPDINVLACQESEDDNQNEDDENGKGGNESNINIGIFESPQILQETSDREDVSRTKNEKEIDETINYQSTTEENVQTEKTDIDNQELDVEAVEFDKEYQKAMSEDKEVLIEDQLNNDTCATEIAEVNNAENGSSETSRMNLDGDVGENDCQLESEGKFESFDVYEIAKEAEETVPKEETKESILEGSSTTMEETSVKEDEENIEESKDTPTSTKTTQVEYVQENGINSSFDDQTSASISLSDGLNQDDQKDKQDESTSFKIGNEMQTEPKLYETNDTSETSGSNSFKDKGSMERNTENSVENKLQQNSSEVFLDSLSAELETETEGETPNKETVKEGISNPSTGAPSIFAVEVSKDKGEEINAVDTETGDSDLATLDETISSEKALQEMNISDDHEYKEKKLETILPKEELEDKSIKKETGTGAEPVFYEASETMETNENEVFKESVAAERNVEKEISDDPHFHENTAEAEDTRVNEMEKEGLKAEKDKESDDEDLKDTISNIGENSNVHESPALITDEMDGADLQIADDLMKKPEKEEAVNVTVEKDIDESLIVEKEITGASKDTSLKAGTATENESKENHEIKASSENKELEDEQLEIENIIQTKQESFNASNANETRENEGFQGKEFTEENISEKEILEYMEHEKSPHVVLEDLETTETKDIQDIETENQGINNNEDNAKKIEASVHSNTEAIPSNSTLKEEIEQLANQLPEREEATNITTEKDNLTELVPQLPNEAADSDALLNFDSESEKNRNIDTNLEKEKFEDTAQEKENDKLELPQSHVANGVSEFDDIIILKENEIADKENCSTKNFSQYEDTIIVEPITESEPEIQSCSSITIEKEITGASKDTSLKAGTATESECKEKHEIKASSENKELEDEQLEIENIMQTKQESFNASNANETKENEGFQDKEFTEENISEKEILEYMEHEKSPHVVLEDLETTETKDIQDIETENQGINNNEDNAKKIEASEAIPSNSTLKEEIEQLANQLPEREEATNITTEKDNLTELVPQLPNEAADSDALLNFDSESEKNRNIDTNLEKEKFEDTAQENENDKLELPRSHVANGASELDDIIILKENEIADKENCSTKNFSQYEDMIIVEPITESEPEIQSCSSITIAKGGHPSEEDYKEEAVAAEDDHLQEQMIEKEEKDDMYEEGKEGRSIEETNITENIIKEELDVHTRLEEEQKEERHIENEMQAEKTTYKSCDMSESNANESNKEKETADNDMLTIERTNESENIPEVNIITENIIKEEGDFHTRLQEEEQNEALHTENEMLVENTTYESCDASESNNNESIKEKERAEKYIVNPEGREIKTEAENIRESEIIDTHTNNEDNLQSNEDVIPETEIDSDDQNTNSILSEKARETESAPQINIETPCDTMDETYVSHDKEMQNDFEAVEEKIHSRVDAMHVSENDEEKKEAHSSLQNKELEHETHTEQELYEASKSSETYENENFEYNKNTKKIDSEEDKLEGKEPDTSSHVSFENFDALAETKDCNHIEPEKQETVTIHEANFDKGEENVTVEESKFGIQCVNHYEDTINEENATPEHLSHQMAEKEATNSTDQGTTAEIKSSNEKEIEETDLSEYDKVDQIDNINEIETEKQDAQIDDEHNLQKGEDVMLVKSTTEASKEDILDACPEALSKIKNEPIEAQIVMAKAINDKDEEVKDVKLVSQEDTKYVQVEEKIHCTQEENSKVLADLEKDNKENRDNSASLQKEELDENPIKDLDGNPRDRKEENEQLQTEQICFESCNSSNIYDNESFPEKGSVSEEELKDQKPENIAVLVPEDLNATPESTIEKETTEFNDEKHVQKEDTMLVESAIIEKSGNESNMFVCGTNGASTIEEAKDDELASQIDVEMTHANALNGNEDPLHKNIENDNRAFDEKIISEASDGHENQSSKERDLIVVESAKIATVSEEKDQDEEQLEENEMINRNMNNGKMQGPQVQNESLALEIDGKMEQSESTNKMGMENTEINTALSKDDKVETVNTKLLNEDKAELDADAVPVDRVKENTDQLTKQNNMLSDNIEMETDDSFSKISNYWPINYNEVVNVNKMETVKPDEKTESSLQLVHDKDMLQEQSLQDPELNQSKQVIEIEQLINTKASPEVENDSIQEENLPFSQFLMKHILMNESDSLKTSYDEEIVDKQDDIDISKEDEKLGPSSVVEQIHHASIADDSAGFHEKLQENNEVQVDDRCDVNDISEAIDNKKDLLTNELPISAVEQTQSTSIVEDKTTNKKPQENKEVQADDNCDVKDNSEVIDNKLETFTMEFPISVAEQTQCTSIVDDKAINEKPHENKEIQVDDKCDVKDNSEFTDNKKEIFTTQLPISVIEQAQHTSIAEDKAYNEMPQENNEVQLDNKCDVIDVSEVVDDEKEFSTMELPIAVDDSMMEHEFDSCIHNEADMQNDVDALKQEDLLVPMPKVQQNGKPKDNAVPERLPNSYDPVQAEKSYGVASDSETNFVRNEDKEENISKTLSEKSIPAIKDQEDVELISTDREIKEDNPNLVMDEQTSEKSLDDTIAEKKILHKKDCNELKAEDSEIIEEEKQEQMLKNGLKDEITVAGLQKDRQTNFVVEPEAALGENNLERNQDINIYEKENEKEQKKFEAPTLSEDKVNSEIKPVENVEDNQDILNQKSDSTEELTLLESQKAQKVDDTNTDDDEDENQEVDEHKGDDSNHDETINVESRDMNVTPTKKKSHGLLSGVGSKVKRSIIKVKKAITGKSSHSETQSAK